MRGLGVPGDDFGGYGKGDGVKVGEGYGDSEGEDRAEEEEGFGVHGCGGGDVG